MKVKIKPWEQMEKEFGKPEGMGFYDFMEQEMPDDRIIDVTKTVLGTAKFWNGWYIFEDMIELFIPDEDMVEKMKENERPFGLLSRQEQDCFKYVGVENVQDFCGGCWAIKARSDWDYARTYRIKPDYLLPTESQYDHREIDYSRTNAMYFIEGGPARLHKAKDKRGFIGYLYEDGIICNTYPLYGKDKVVSFSKDMLCDIEVHYPTHVVFRKEVK